MWTKRFMYIVCWERQVMDKRDQIAYGTCNYEISLVSALNCSIKIECSSKTEGAYAQDQKKEV